MLNLHFISLKIYSYQNPSISPLRRATLPRQCVRHKAVLPRVRPAGWGGPATRCHLHMWVWDQYSICSYNITSVLYLSEKHQNYEKCEHILKYNVIIHSNRVCDYNAYIHSAIWYLKDKYILKSLVMDIRMYQCQHILYFVPE